MRMENRRLHLILVLVTSWIIVADARRGRKLHKDGLNFKRYGRKNHAFLPTDDDENHGSSGNGVPTLQPFDKPLIFERVQYDGKSPTEVEIYLPEEENDRKNLDGVKNFDYLDEDPNVAMLQANEFDPIGDYTSDCEVLSIFGVECANEVVEAGEEDPTTAPVTISSTKATTTSMDETEPPKSTDSAETKAMPSERSTAGQNTSPDLAERSTAMAPEEQTVSTTKSSTTNIKITPTQKPEGTDETEGVVATTRDTELVIPDILPVTDSVDAKKPNTDASESEEKDSEEHETAATTKATPQTVGSAVEESVSKPNDEPQASSQAEVGKEDSQTTITQDMTIKNVEETTLRSTEKQEDFIGTDPSAGGDMATTAVVDMATKAIDTAASQPTKEEKQHMDVEPSTKSPVLSSASDSADSAKGTEAASTPPPVQATTMKELKVTHVIDKAVTAPEVVKVMSTKSEENQSKPPSAVTPRIKNPGSEATTVESAVSPQQSGLSTIVIIVCVVSLLILLILLIIIVVVVRARLKHRGKYAITSQVDSGEGAASPEGAQPNAPKDSDEKVVTVQYNGPSA